MTNSAMRAEIEDLLDSKGAEWDFVEELDTKLIDVQRSMANQARIGAPINSEQVVTYEEGMRRGDVFPAIVVYRTSGGKYVVIDGNHRVAAALSTGYKLAAYILDARKTPAQVIVMLTYEANTRHGLPTSQAERARHAVYLIENANETIKNAAARMNLPTHYLSRFYSQHRADQRATEVGIPPTQWRDLHVGSRERLNALADDNVYKAAVEYAFRARLTAVEVGELVTTLRTLKTSEDQLEAIQRAKEEQADRLAAVATGEVRPRRVRQGGPRQSLRSAIYMTESLVGDKRQQMLDGITPIEAGEYLGRIDSTLSILSEIREELEKKAGEE